MLFVLNAFHRFVHLLLATHGIGRYYYFTDEETEATQCKITHAGTRDRALIHLVELSLLEILQKPLYFFVERDLGSLEFLKGVWAQKEILCFREKCR